MGIEAHDIRPRENVFTFNAWKALGRVVRKGQHGVRIITRVPCSKTDKSTGEVTSYTRPRTTTVFHLSQTEAMDCAPGPVLTDEEQARAAGFGCVAAWKNPNFMEGLAAHSEAYRAAVANEEAGRRADYAGAFALLETGYA